MTKWAVVDEKDQVVWGTGGNENAALKDAKGWLQDHYENRQYSLNEVRKAYTVLPCSESFYEAVREWGGSAVLFQIIGCKINRKSVNGACPNCYDSLADHHHKKALHCLEQLGEQQ